MPSALTTALTTLCIRVILQLSQPRHLPCQRRPTGERGQATTEYALVLLAAALVGLMVVGWATAGGGAERIGRLFNSVIDSVIDRV
jgi:cytochrome b561